MADNDTPETEPKPVEWTVEWTDEGNYGFYVGAGWSTQVYACYNHGWDYVRPAHGWRYFVGRGWSQDDGKTITEFPYKDRPVQ